MDTDTLPLPGSQSTLPSYLNPSSYSLNAQNPQARLDRTLEAYKQIFGTDIGDAGVAQGKGTSDPYGYLAQFYNNPNLTSTSQFAKAMGKSTSYKQFVNPNIPQANAALNKAPLTNPVDTYNQALDSLGMGDARTRVTGLRTQLLNTENLLKNVEGDISARTQDSLVTENQRRKLVAGEQAPLVQQTDTLGRNLDVGLEDYQMIQNEAMQQADLKFKGEQEERQFLMSRLENAIASATRKEDRRRWTAELNRMRAKDAEATRQYNQTLAEQQRQFNLDLAFQKRKLETSLAEASSGGSSGGGGGSSSGGGSYSGGSGGSGSSLTQAGAKSEFLSYIAGKFKSAGKNPSRQTQDAWANAWFAQKGVSSPADRQFYWDSMNSTYNRPENPYSDWLYKR